MSKRITLAFMAALFFGPVLVAYFWFFYFSEDSEFHTVNKGELVDPPVSMVDVALMPRNGEETVFPFKDDWSIVLLAPRACGPDCESALHTTRQVWRRLNRDMNRVQRLLVAGEDVDVDTSQHPLLDVYNYTPLVGKRFDAALPLHDAGTRVLLIDPMGNLMLTYPLELEPDSLYDDLTRLLRYSKTG